MGKPLLCKYIFAILRVTYTALPNRPCVILKPIEANVGYIGSEYAFAQKIPYASVYNKRGELVVPSTESISAAAGDIPQDTRCSITDADAAGAYPISCFTWLLIYKEQHYADRSMEQAKATLDLMQYMLSDSVQQTTATVHYAPLPKKAIEQSLQNLKAVTYDGQPILK